MIPTLAYVRRRFDELNRQCFGGTLPPIAVSMCRARTFLGKIVFKKRRQPGGGWVNSDFELRISVTRDLPQDTLDDTLLHEMIHYHILHRQMQDTSAHGQLFRAMMADINRRFGRNITVTHRTTAEENDSDTQVRQHWICVLRFADGHTGLTVAMRSSIFALWDGIARWPQVQSWRWYTTLDPYFNRFRRVRTVKAVRIDPADLEPHLTTAKPLLRDGSRIYIKR